MALRIRIPVRHLCTVAAALFVVAAAGADEVPRGFEQAFNGHDLTGWTMVGQTGPGYIVKDGILICPAGESANLFTTKEYSDFDFQFDFKLDAAGNNGIGIRAPLEGDAAYMGMECQILDDSSPDYANLLPGQYHSSLYRIVAARRGSLKPVGSWNHEEIVGRGRHIKVTVNGMVTVDADLNTVTDPETLGEHPGMLRPMGHLGFLGHGPSEVDFRNVYLKDLGGRPARDNTPPPGFTALFNGHDLRGWKALVGNPATRRDMTPDELAAKQKKADIEAFKHWHAEHGEIVYDGKNDNLCTDKKYGNFEMMVDWKINAKGDSGIYLRGSPQVQIWDNPLGSGGLYNNQKNPSNPLVVADNPIGEWNHFDILMVGDKVTVYLNNKLVVNHVTMENYWERDKPIYPVEQIELQHHGDSLWFKNIYIRELP
jgi:hypothetical protein